MCDQHGIVFLPWGPLTAGGSAALDAVAAKAGATPPQVALAWLLRRSPNILPIPGTSSLGHMEENVGAVSVRLDDDDFARLDAAAS